MIYQSFLAKVEVQLCYKYKSMLLEFFFEQVKDKVKILKGIEKPFYGATEFIIEDNNGFMITFAENE